MAENCKNCNAEVTDFFLDSNYNMINIRFDNSKIENNISQPLGNMAAEDLL